MDLREVVERCLRVEAPDTDPLDQEPEVLVRDRASEMRGRNEGDSFDGGVASGVWVAFSVGGSISAVKLPFSSILRSPDHRRRGGAEFGEEAYVSRRRSVNNEY